MAKRNQNMDSEYERISKIMMEIPTGENCVERDERKKRDQTPKKKFVRYKEGAEIYSMCQTKFEKMARDAKAIYKLDKLVLVNMEIFENYLETFRLA